MIGCFITFHFIKVCCKPQCTVTFLRSRVQAKNDKISQVTRALLSFVVFKSALCVHQEIFEDTSVVNAISFILCVMRIK